MKKTFLIVLLINICLNLKAQHIFPVKLNNCVTNTFCLDCGDEKAGFKENEFNTLINTLNKTYDYSRISGKILFQVLVDSTGSACVLSHTDNSKSQITQNLINAFNNFHGWLPSKTKGKIEGLTSINLAVEINKGVLTASVMRVDQQAFTKSFDRPRAPEIYNKTYVYKNEHLKDYNIKTWDSKNSGLPDNFNDHLTIDNDNTVWLTTEQGLVTFNGSAFTKAEQNITPKGDYFSYHALATDNNNVKWVSAKNNIYSYNNTKWTILDKKQTGINGAYKIINNAQTGEVYFCSDEGLIIYKNGNWSTLDKTKVLELPSDRVYFAKKDLKGRIWIGTFSGSVMIDEAGKATAFNNTNTVLKGKCIDAMDEDENGNIYLALFEYQRKDPKAINADEGFAIYATDGTCKQFTTDNSGIPFNHVTKLLYDKREKVLWIATDRAGLVRYNLKDTWENYHNENSPIPTSYIADMAFDSNGALYLATRQGLVKIERK